MKASAPLNLCWLCLFAIGCNFNGLIGSDDSGATEEEPSNRKDAGMSDAGGDAHAPSGDDSDSRPDQAPAARSLGDLSGPWQLFVDDYLVETKSNVVRRYHPFNKSPQNPVLTPEKTWEGHIDYIYGSVLPNEEKNGYRMWYTCMDDAFSAFCCYATSIDGVTWSKPNLDVHSYQGSTDNNMVYPGADQHGMTSVIHTPWEQDRERQYHFVNYREIGFSGSYSSNGIHIVDVPNNPVFNNGGDVGQFLWDAHTRQYVGYVKSTSYVNGLKRRSVARITSADILSWTEPQIVLQPDSQDDRWAAGKQCTHFYGLSAFAYESMYIGMLWIFRSTDNQGENGQGYFIGPVYSEIVSSHDGIAWNREEGDRPAVVALGASGSWDGGQLYTATQPILVGNELWLYYGGCNKEHGTATQKINCAVGLGTLRKDGFASLDAGATEAEVTTKRLKGAMGGLLVNYAAEGGSLRVEILDGNHQVVNGYSRNECDPLSGDSITQRVSWGAVSDLPPGPLYLRFVLMNASLYSFQAGEQVELDP